jgi:hypothetical protein
MESLGNEEEEEEEDIEYKNNAVITRFNGTGMCEGEIKSRHTGSEDFNGSFGGGDPSSEHN